MGEQYRERVAALYANVDPLDLAMRVVSAEGERDRYRAAWSSARLRAARTYGAWRHVTAVERAAHEEMNKQDDFARTLWGWLTERRKERDRYRLAWLSARRRAAEEANLGAEAVEHIAADRDRWQRGHERAEAQLVVARRRIAELEAGLLGDD